MCLFLQTAPTVYFDKGCAVFYEMGTTFLVLQTSDLRRKKAVRSASLKPVAVWNYLTWT
jgi:hypothetical protein